MRIETAYILRDLVAGLSFTEPIKSVTDNGNGTYTLEVCKTYHLQPICGRVTIDTVEYKVTSIEDNKSVTVIAGSPPPQTNIVISAPKYFFGTMPAVNDELSRITNTSNKLPLVYLFEVINERFNNDDGVSIDRYSPLRLFFLGPANFEAWETSQHYENAIIPMKNLALAFIDEISKPQAYGFGEFDEFTLTNHVKFGVFSDLKGHTTSIFNEHLSGVELRLTLPIKKSIACPENGCNC